MAKEKKSRLAAKLRELGFKPFTELLSPEDFRDTEMYRVLMERNVTRGMNRAERRKFRAIRKEVLFFRTPTYTYAVDETGADWGIEKSIDLTPFGFTDGLRALNAKGTLQ